MNDFSEFTSIHKTSDNLFKRGFDGVTDILVPPDGKSEFILFKDKTLVALNSLTGINALYTLPETSFEPKAKAVLMDLDGTSVQSETFWIWIIEQSIKALLQQHSFKLEEEDFPFVSGFSVSEHLKYCIDKYGNGQSVEEARSYYFKITSHEMSEILHGRGKVDAFTPTEGLKEFLMTLKSEGVKIGLVTSGLYEKAMPEILSAFKQLDMGDPMAFYDAVITAGSTYSSNRGGTPGELCAKPHPWLYAETARVGLGIKPFENHKVIGIEDSSAGVMSLKLAGYEVVGFAGGNISDAGLNGLLYKKAGSLLEILPWIL